MNDLTLDAVINLHVVIDALIRERERDLDHELAPDNKKFLQDTIAETVRAGITKYIKGSIEHGEDFLTSVDHLQELFKENLDAIFYCRAALLKQQQFDKRYDSSI